MPIAVPCPQCGSVLKAPDGSAGRKARCKKCQHGFVIPGGDAPAAEVGSETMQLSVSDAPAFSFDGPAANDEPPAEQSRSSIRSSRTGSHRGQPVKSKSGGMLIVLGLGAILAAGGAAAYFLTRNDTPAPPAKPVAQASAASSAPPAKPETPPAKDKEKEPVKKQEPKNKEAPTTSAAAKATPKNTKPRTMVTGGLKLPAPPAKAEALTKPIAKASIEIEYAKVRKFFVGGGDNGVSAVLSSSTEGFQGAGGKDMIDRYNLTTGDRIDHTEIVVDNAPWPRACDLSADGEYFVSEGPAGMLTVYDLNAKAKASEPFKPFVTDEKQPPPLAAAMMVDRGTVLVACTDGRVELWNAKEGKKTAAGTVGAPITGKSCTPKADRSGMLIVAGGSLHEMPAATLTPKALLSLPHGGGEGLAIALDSSERVAIAYKAAEPGPHTRIVVARSGDPAPTLDQQLDDTNGTVETIEWCGPEAFTLGYEKGAALVFETEINRAMAAIFPAGGGRHAILGGKHYMLMPDDDGKKCLLIGIDFPPNDFLPLRNEAMEAKKPIPFLVNSEGYGR